MNWKEIDPFCREVVKNTLLVAKEDKSIPTEMREAYEAGVMELENAGCRDLSLERLGSWETPEDFVRRLESTTWPNDTRATVPVPPGVIKRAIRDIRRLLEALEEARMTGGQRAMKAAGKRSLSSELEKKDRGKSV